MEPRVQDAQIEVESFRDDLVPKVQEVAHHVLERQPLGLHVRLQGREVHGEGGLEVRMLEEVGGHELRIRLGLELQHKPDVVG